MPQDTHPIEVYLEIGRTRTFAVALDWPGWARSGRDEASALQSLYAYGPRYARALAGSRLGFRAPSDPASLVVVERLTGNATTDFGSPAIALSRDAEPAEGAELRRWQVVLAECWRTLDTAVERAAGRTLTKGPRGGGRDLEKIVQHVREVDLTYLSKLGGKLDPGVEGQSGPTLDALRASILAALGAAVRGEAGYSRLASLREAGYSRLASLREAGYSRLASLREIPARGPHGGLHWTPRYFVRRLAWHELDHAWEIEDRAG
jgi:hypothetical protein